VQLRGLADRIEGGGVSIASVTIGDPARAAGFCERFVRNRYPCLGDPELAAYHAYGLPRGSWLDVAGPRVWGAGASAIRHGVASRPGDDVLRLGGTFAIRTDGTLAYVHYARTSSDNADPLVAAASLR
jgi:peroxiredoxin